MVTISQVYAYIKSGVCNIMSVVFTTGNYICYIVAGCFIFSI